MSAFSLSNEKLPGSSLFNSYIIFHPLGTIKVISSSRLSCSSSGAPGLRKERALFLALCWPGNRPGSGPSRAGEGALVTGGRKAAGPCLSGGHVLRADRGWVVEKFAPERGVGKCRVGRGARLLPGTKIGFWRRVRFQQKASLAQKGLF